MPLTLVVTQDVADRYRGFFASVMPEVAPGVYISPSMTAGVRERAWSVAEAWWDDVPGGSILMAYSAKEEPGGIGLRVLGLPRVELADLDGIRLVFKRASDGL